MNVDQPNLEDQIRTLELEIAETENLTPNNEYEMKRNLMKLERLNKKHCSLIAVQASNYGQSFSEKLRKSVVGIFKMAFVTLHPQRLTRPS